MIEQRARWLAGVMLVLASVGLAGCSSGYSTPNGSSVPSASPLPPSAAAPSQSPLPPRPAVLRLDGVDPCVLLTAAQLQLLAVNPGKPSQNNDGIGSRDCLWRNFPAKPDNGWLARAILAQGAEYYLNSVTGAQIVQVDGFPAVETSSSLADPDKQCLLYVDVAPGQSLEVQYLNGAGDYPGINRQVACQLAVKATELMLANLRNVVH